MNEITTICMLMTKEMVRNKTTYGKSLMFLYQSILKTLEVLQVNIKELLLIFEP